MCRCRYQRKGDGVSLADGIKDLSAGVLEEETTTEKGRERTTKEAWNPSSFQLAGGIEHASYHFISA